MAPRFVNGMDTVIAPPPEDGRAVKAMDSLEDLASNVVTDISALQDVYASSSTAIMTILSSKQFGDIAAPLQQALNALDALQSIHPFIAIAVVAVKAVVNLELKRRANDRRIAAVYAAIIDMLSVLFELAEIKEDDRYDPATGQSMKGRLILSLEGARDEIKTAANSVDKYSKTRLVVKVLKSNQWEDKLTEHIETFGNRKREIRFAIEVHTTVAVDKMRSQITDMSNMLAKVLKNQTTKEKELQALIDAKGGSQAVVNNDEALMEISVKYEEKDSWEKASSRTKEPPKVLDASLKLELSSNLDDLLKANEALFLKKFDAQISQLKDAMARSADRVIKALSKGPYERIEDPDMRALWREEKWRSSVKTRHIILSLYDYFTTPHVPTDEDGPGEIQKLTYLTLSHPDYWTLDFMTAFYLTAIQDALDDDRSGFVSVKEMNEFTSAKPKDMSLPVWIAYWAAGWFIDCDVYENKIAKLIKQMKDMADEVLDENKEAVQAYLDSDFGFIEKLTTFSANEDDSNLIQTTEKLRAAAENRIWKQLEDIKFEVDGDATLFAVCGPGRIDKYLLPLTYLLLKRHAQIIKLCKEYILDPRELELAQDSVWTLIDQVYNRISALKEGFTQQRLDLDSAFQFFCNGLYDDLYVLWFRDKDSDSDSDSDDDDDEETEEDQAEEHEGEAVTGENTDAAAEPGEGGAEDDDGEDDDTGDAESQATTAPEEVIPISVNMLRFPATKAEKEVIEAHEAKLAEAKQAAEEADNNREKEDEQEPPSKTIEERLDGLEQQMNGLHKLMTELLRRLPARRR